MRAQKADCQETRLGGGGCGWESAFVDGDVEAWLGVSSSQEQLVRACGIRESRDSKELCPSAMTTALISSKETRITGTSRRANRAISQPINNPKVREK